MIIIIHSRQNNIKRIKNIIGNWKNNCIVESYRKRRRDKEQNLVE